MQRKIYTAFIALYIIINIFPVNAHPNNIPQWNLVVLMCADNNLADYLYHIQDINEMEVIGSTSKVQVFVLLDTKGNNDTVLYRIVKDYAGKDATIRSPIIKKLGEVDFSNSYELNSILQYIKKNYPANHFAVDFWGHGAFYKGVFDDKGRLLSLNNIQEVLKNISPDVVIFDACRMGSVETLYALKNLTKYAIAAENDIVGDGLPYEILLENLNTLNNISPQIFAVKVVASYSQWIEKSPVPKSCVLSAYNITQFSLDFPKFKKYIFSLNSSLPLMADTIKNAIKDTETYEAKTNGDLIHFIENLENLGDVRLKNISENFSKVVNRWIIKSYAYNYGGDVNNAHGLSIYLPKSIVDPYYRVCSFSSESKWYFFLRNLYSSEKKELPLRFSSTLNNFTLYINISNSTNFTDYVVYVTGSENFTIETQETSIKMELEGYGEYRIDVYGFINTSLYGHSWDIINITYPIWINGSVVMYGVAVEKVWIVVNNNIYEVPQNRSFHLKLNAPVDAKIGDSYKIIVVYQDKTYEYEYTINSNENFVKIREITDTSYLLIFSIITFVGMAFFVIISKK